MLQFTFYSLLYSLLFFSTTYFVIFNFLLRFMKNFVVQAKTYLANSNLTLQFPSQYFLSYYKLQSTLQLSLLFYHLQFHCIIYFAISFTVHLFYDFRFISECILYYTVYTFNLQ